MRTIVVGFDDTEPARRALERAAELAEALDGRLVVTSVAPLIMTSPRSVGPHDPVDPPEEHQRQLDDARALLAERPVEAEFVPADGEPADTIILLADERDADLIVVGTREPGVLERLLGQSVSAAVARKADRDVLIVH